MPQCGDRAPWGIKITVIRADWEGGRGESTSQKQC